MEEKSKYLILGLGIGAAAASGIWWILNKRKAEEERLWNNKKIKKNILELVGHTPVIHLATLSKALGNDVYVDFEIEPS